MKKFLALVLILCMALPFASAFAEEERAEATWFMYDVASFVEPWQTDPIVQYASDAVGINFTVMTAPWGECDTKMNLLLASGELPDVFMNMWYPWTENFIYSNEDGAFAELTELIPNYPNLQAYLKSEPSYDQLLVDGDRVFGIPRYYNPVQNRNIIVREDLLTKYGFAVPTTWDELHDALATIVPAENIAGLTMKDDGWLACFLIPWIGGPIDYIKNEEGQYVHAYTTEGYRNGLRYFHSWYEEGLLDPDFMLGQQNIDIEKLAAGKCVAALAQWNPEFVTQHREPLKEAIPGAEEAILPYLKGPEGTEDFGVNGAVVDHNASAYLGWALINAESDHVEKILAFYDFILANDGALLTDGIEGVHFTVGEDGTKTYTDEYYAELESDSWNFNTGTTMLCMFVDYRNENTGRLMPTIENADLINPGWQAMLDAKPVTRTWTYCFNSENNINYGANISTVMAEYRTAFLTGEKDLDADWEEYLEALNDVGYQDVMADLNAWMAEHE